MRFLYVTPRYLPQLSGAEWAAHGYATALARRGHEVTVVTATPGPPGAKAERTLDGVRILHGRVEPDLARFIVDLRPDVVFGQLRWAPDAVAAARAAGLPAVVVCHAPGDADRAPRAALYVFPSRALEERSPGLPHVVVPPPVDAARVAPPPGVERRFVTAVNLSRAKGGALFWALARHCSDRSFLAVRGGYGDQIIEDLPNVEVRDPTPAMGEIYAASYVVLLPSRGETFGLVGVEAQMAGVPVVAADLPALRESLGEGAIFVAGGDAESWVAAIATLDGPAVYEAFASAARANAARYDPDVIGRLLDSRLGEVVEPGPRVHAGSAQVTAPETPLALPVPGTRAIVCAIGAAGQAAYTMALVSELSFEAVPLDKLDPYLAAGAPVLVNGWWPEFASTVERYPGQFHIVWHSGWSGSDLMGEGDHLAHVLGLLQAGRIKLYWLDRRDVPPAGARHLAPIWSPAGIARMLPEQFQKRPGTAMAAVHGEYPTLPKNVTATIVGALQGGAEVHVGRSALERRGASVLDRLLAERPHVLHDTLSQADFLKLLAEMEVLVHPSFSETWPTVIIQAAYVGTPAVISDVVAWSHLLPERARALCIVRPATSTSEIARLTRHLLASPDDRAYLLAEQRRVLDELLPGHVEAAAEELRAAGFPVWAVNKPEDLTVFVLTVGEPSTEECVQRLRAQDISFQLEIIDRVAPMNKAFQAMLDRCNTRYYVQVDADMLLKPDAIRMLYQKMRAQSPDVAMYVAWLWGDDVKRPIQGIKIYNHDICDQFPYLESLSCEVSQLNAMAAAGYHYVAQDEPRAEAACVGVHLACQTPALTYQRWRRLGEKHRKLPWMGWLEKHIPELRARFLQDPNPVNTAALLGVVVGLGVEPKDREMDFREGCPEFAKIWEYLGEGPVDTYCGSFDAVVQEAARVESLKKYTGGANPPREAVLYLTDKCPHKCPFCKRQLRGRVDGLDWSEEGEKKPREDMEPALVRRFLDTFPSIQAACLAGFGEPLCHPQLDEIVKILAERSVCIGLITNGSLLYHQRETVAMWPLDYLSVSLNAVSPEAHRIATGVDTWEAVLTGLKWFASETRLNVGASFVAHRENVHEIPELIRLGGELNLKFLHVVNLLPHDNLDDPWFLSHVLTGDCPEAALLEEYKAMPGADLVKVWPAPIDLRGEPPRRCQSPFVSIGFNSWAHTSLCRRIEDPIKYQGAPFWVEGVWNNEQNTNLRKAMVGSLPLPARCRRCFGNYVG